MSAPSDERPAVLGFLDAFFQERNIKWMLGIGILILLGSSLMLVTAHWDDYTPVWKYLILLGYTAGIHGLGQLAYHSLGLRKTGTGLMVLTVLLIPITFLALHWVHPAALTSWSGLFSQAGLLVLLAGNTVFSLLAARRIFNHFLRRPQPTFVACYGLLSLAGAIVTAIPTSLAPLTALCLWLVFVVGATKVNRHVFWLTEEHRLPRICGFFPILLLGGMFAALFSVSLAPHIPLTWIGFGLVLTAVPVLLTADALAHAFQQRNVELPNPLPWGIVLPIFVGLCLTASGLCLAGIGFPGTHSLPPTALLAAVVLGVTARRTRRTGFVWLMLGAIVIGYQTCPVFFRETVRTVAQHGADAIHEQRLPYAFYGVTYLPLLVVLSGVAAWLQRRKETLFSTPLRQLATVLGLVLLATSIAHAKAVFPVGLALTALFGLQLMLFRDRRLLPAAIAAFALAGLGFQTFWEQVLQYPHSSELPLIAWTSAATLLLVPGRLIDRRTVFEPDSLSHWQTAPLCRLSSLCILTATAAIWLLRAGAWGQVATMAGIAIGALLLIHAWQFAIRHVGRLAWGVSLLIAGILATEAGWSFAEVISLESLLLLGLWIVGRHVTFSEVAEVAFESPQPSMRTKQRVLRLAGADIALCGLGGIAVLYVLPLAAWSIVTGAPFSAWIAGIASLVWVIDAARQRQSGVGTAIAWLLSHGMLGVALASVGGWESIYEWYPALATVLPALTIGFLRTNRETTDATRPQRVLRVCAVATLACVGIGSLLIFSLPMRVAGLAAFAVVLWSAARWNSPALRTAAFTVATWQVLVAVLQLTLPHLQTLGSVPLPLVTATAVPLALASALLSFAWSTDWIKRRTISEVPLLHRVALLILTGACLTNSILHRSGGLSLFEAVLAVALFALLAIEQLWTARRRANADSDAARSPELIRELAELHVWLATIIAAVGAGYFKLMGMFALNGTVCLFVPPILGALLFAIGRAARSSAIESQVVEEASDCDRASGMNPVARGGWSIVSRPFTRLGLLLPAATVGIAMYRHITVPDPRWLGANSLALLLAAAFYFWRGLEQRALRLVVAAAAILNVASVLLWRELECTDLQFFMIPLGLTLLGLIELLKPQIPHTSIDPLRWIGALTILVSPTFHIVSGSWMHLLTLLIASVLITLAAIGLRVRALMYAGTGFLAADLVAMVVRGSLDNASLLWIVGILVGGAVISLAAYCERHRELMLQRVRMLAATLESWE